MGKKSQILDPDSSFILSELFNLPFECTHSYTGKWFSMCLSKSKWKNDNQKESDYI